jgi:uncharacterized protein HemX
MPIILLLVKRFWPAILIVTTLSVAGLYWYDRTATIRSQATTIVRLETEKAEIKAHYEGEVAKLQGTINHQNEEVERLKQVGEQSKQALDAAVARAQEVKRVYRDEIKRILEGSGPQTCEDAIKYLIDGKDYLKW